MRVDALLAEGQHAGERKDKKKNPCQEKVETILRACLPEDSDFVEIVLLFGGEEDQAFHVDTERQKALHIVSLIHAPSEPHLRLGLS